MILEDEVEAHQRESGFGLIEIVISMFLLGLLAVAFLPLLMNSVRTTVNNSSIATATQLVNQEMKRAQLAGDTCALIIAYGATSVPVVPADSRGVSYQPAHTVGPCPLAYPDTVFVTVSITVVGSTLPPVTATTRVLVKAA